MQRGKVGRSGALGSNGVFLVCSCHFTLFLSRVQIEINVHVPVASGTQNGSTKSSLSAQRIRHMTVLISDPLKRESCFTQHIGHT
jgi:hypothetical protein